VCVCVCVCVCINVYEPPTHATYIQEVYWVYTYTSKYPPPPSIQSCLSIYVYRYIYTYKQTNK